MPIELTQLSHTYMPGSALAYPALGDISLTVQDGEFLGIIGPNGVRKSTFMECLVGLLPLNEGAVSFHGAPLPIMR